MLRGEKCRKHHYCLFGVNEIQPHNFSKTMAWSNVSTSAGKKLWKIRVKAILQAACMKTDKKCLQLRHLAKWAICGCCYSNWAFLLFLAHHGRHPSDAFVFSSLFVIEKTPSPFLKRWANHTFQWMIKTCMHLENKLILKFGNEWFLATRWDFNFELVPHPHPRLWSWRPGRRMPIHCLSQRKRLLPSLPRIGVKFRCRGFANRHSAWPSQGYGSRGNTRLLHQTL